MAKYDLGKVRLEPMQSAVSLLQYMTYRAALWRFAELLQHIALLVLCCQLIVADHLLCILVNLCGFLPLPVPPSWLLVSV